MKTFAVRVLIALTTFAVLGVCGAQAATLIGVVADQTGAVIRGASVAVYSGGHEWRTQTNAQGAFQVELPKGTYDVEVAQRGFRKRIIKTVRLGIADRTIRATLDVGSTADECFAPRVTYLTAAGETSSRGLVRGKENRVLPGVKVSISTEDDPAAGFARSRTVGVARTNQKGEFVFPNLSPGLYRLDASIKGYTHFDSSNLRVRPGKVAQVVFVMKPPGYICQ